MAIIKSFSPFQNLSNFQTFLVDDNPISDYFRITEFKDTLTGGKNGFLIEGSEFLKETTEVKIELLDVEGTPIYFEPGDGIPEYYEGTSKLVSVHVYDDTPIGLGKITILGELKNYVNENGSVVPVPQEWRGIYNVKWERTFKVNKNLSNEDIVRFYKRPLVNIDELVKPIFTKSVNQVTDSESTVTGVAQLPNAGTDLSNYRGGTFYKLIKSSGIWDIDVDENVINVDVNGSTYSPTIIEVLNNREVLVDIPYTDNSIVSNFVSQSYSVTYTDFQNETPVESSLIGSFAKIDITQLKTFVGDVARVKVFRKSRSSANDFQFVQESKLESTELLRDITTQTNNEIPYGNFSVDTLNTYWTASNLTHPITVDSSVLSQAVKVDYAGSGVQRLTTKESFNISKDVEYTLNFRTLLSGSISDDKYLKAYFSGSYLNGNDNETQFTQSFVDITPDGSYVVRKNITENIIAQRNIDAKLVFEFRGDDWYISNVSLKNAQDTSFSPDEFTLIQDIPRKLASETFDFRFEFYDINNNYIPVNVVATKTFNGGNDFNTTSKLLTFESDRNAFRFSSGSVQNPENQLIQFKVTQQNLTGSLTFASSAFDVDGNYLQPSEYTQYPGFLTNITPAGALVTINNFTGSRIDGNMKPFVGSIIYTASIEDKVEFETVYRLEDGDNAPQLIVTSNANQFIYEPTTLSPKPSGQNITIRAQRKNLSLENPGITVNSGSSNDANVDSASLEFVDTVNGIDTYIISANKFSSSFADNNFDEVTYSFTGSDVFGNKQVDEITISKVINFDGVSVTLSNESTTFRANSVGKILDDSTTGDGEVEMRIGNVVIEHDDSYVDGNQNRNTFDIISAAPFSVSESYSPYTSSLYGIHDLTADNGSLVLTIRYLAGDGVTSQTFQKKVNYTKNRIAPPTITIDTTNKTQNVDAKSTGVQITSFEDSLLTIKEIYTGSITTFSSDSASVNFDLPNPNTIASYNDLTISYDNLISSSDSTQVQFTATVIDSEGTSRNISDSISLSKSKKAAPVLSIETSNKDQSVIAKSTGEQSGSFLNSNVIVKEQYDGNTTLLTITQLTATRNDTSNSISTTPSTGLITLNEETLANNINSTTVSISAIVEDSEGEERTISDTISLSKVKNAPPNTLVTISPQSQTVTSSSLVVGNPRRVSVSVSEGGDSYIYEPGSLSEYEFSIVSVVGGDDNFNGTFTPDKPISSFTTGSVTVAFVNSEGTSKSQTLFFDVSTAAAGASGSNGDAGPGIVMRGEYDPNTLYKFSVDVGNGLGRRDAVYLSSVGYYYATLQETQGNEPSGDATDNAYWQFLGEQDFFVAAKIAIFEDSFIKNTLNVGLNAEGDEANIAIVGGSTEPYIALGQSTPGVYGAGGIFIGTDGGSQKLSLVGGNNSLNWDGTDLSVSGSIFATDGVIGGFTIGETSLYNTKNSFGNASAGVYLGNDGISLGVGNAFSVNSNGSLTANDVTITGGILQIGSNFSVANDGTLNATDGIFNGEINAEGGTIGGFTIGTSDISATNINISAGNAAITMPALSISAGSSFTTPSSGNIPTSTPGVSTQSDTYTIPLNDQTSVSVYDTGGTQGAFSAIFVGNFVGQPAALDFTLTPQSIGHYALGYATAVNQTASSANISATVSCTLHTPSGTITKTFTVTNSSTDFNNLSVGGTLNGTFQFTLESGQYYISTAVDASSFYRAFGNITTYPFSLRGDAVFRAPVVTIGNVGVVDNFTEINAGGVQVYSSATKFVRMPRDVSSLYQIEMSGSMKVSDTIYCNGNIIAYYSSDERLKDNLVRISDPIQKLSILGGYEFDWNDNQNIFEGHDVGVIAQEVQSIFPSIVKPHSSGYLGVNYEKLVPLLIEGINELNKKVEDLENKLKDS